MPKIGKINPWCKVWIPPPPCIVLYSGNQLGSIIFSALYSFWIAQHLTVNRNSLVGTGRMNVYSLILFNNELSMPISDNFTSF